MIRLPSVAVLLVAILLGAIGIFALPARVAAPEDLPRFSVMMWPLIALSLAGFATGSLHEAEAWCARFAPYLLGASLLALLAVAGFLVSLTPLVRFILCGLAASAAAVAAHHVQRQRGLGGGLTKRSADAASGLLCGWMLFLAAREIPVLVRAQSDLLASDRVWLSLWLVLVPSACAALLLTRFISRSLWIYVALIFGWLCLAYTHAITLQLHGLAIITLAFAALVLHLRLTRFRI